VVDMNDAMMSAKAAAQTPNRTTLDRNMSTSIPPVVNI